MVQLTSAFVCEKISVIISNSVNWNAGVLDVQVVCRDIITGHNMEMGGHLDYGDAVDDVLETLQKPLKSFITFTRSTAATSVSSQNTE